MLTIRDIKRAEANGLNESALRKRISDGWDKEKAITTPPLKRNMKPYYEIAKKNGIPEQLVRSRIYTNDWDIEKAITEPKKVNGQHRKWYDEAVKNGLDITFQGFRSRLYNGWTLEEAMTTPRKEKRNNSKSEYQKYREIAEENGISRQSFSMRVRNYGWSYERASTEPIQTKYRKRG